MMKGAMMLKHRLFLSISKTTFVVTKIFKLHSFPFGGKTSAILALLIIFKDEVVGVRGL